ncbi:MAG: hypothetical protein EXX96DRAFT_48133 [Benjaminiella poitrasii]|nr:MAG: hypothetical protein EXX96DRAFT_48133 [Benjaminiella poitrasii]
MKNDQIFLVLLLLIFLYITQGAHTNKEQENKISLLKEKIVIDHGLELYKNLQNQESDCFKKVTLKLIQGCNSLNIDSIENMEC